MKHAPLALFLLTTACGPDRLGAPAPGAQVPGPVPSPSTVAQPLTPCVVTVASADTHAIRAVPGGLIVGNQGSFARHTGSGCALQRAGAVFAKDGESRVQTDNPGNVYVMPARSTDANVIATEPENDGFSAGVVRIDAKGQIETLVSRGRWIAGFSVSPEGHELTLYGCAATGLHKETTEGWSWDQVTSQRAHEAGGLNEASVAVGGGAIVMAVNGVLLRVTAEGAEPIGEAAVIFGANQQITRCGPAPQHPRTLDRCGGEICGVFADGVATWTADGALARILSRDDIEIADDETFEQVTGDADGLYLLLRGAEGARVMFVPTP